MGDFDFYHISNLAPYCSLYWSMTFGYFYITFTLLEMRSLLLSVWNHGPIVSKVKFKMQMVMPHRHCKLHCVRDFIQNGLKHLTLPALFFQQLSHSFSASASAVCSGNFPLGIKCDTVGSSLPPSVCVFLSPPSTIQQMIRHWDQHLLWLLVVFLPTCASQAHPFLLKRASRGEIEGERWCPVGGRRVDWWSIPATQLVVSV